MELLGSDAFTADTTLQELDDLLSEYDMERDLVEINRKAPQWAHKAVWNRWYMEPKAVFFRPTPLGFRQVVQHVRLHVAEMSELIN